MTYPYYRATLWLPNLSDCTEWYDWFKSLGQSAYLVRSRRGYAVWVDGEESVSDQTYVKANTEAINGVIIERYPGIRHIPYGARVTKEGTEWYGTVHPTS